MRDDGAPAPGSPTCSSSSGNGCGRYAWPGITTSFCQSRRRSAPLPLPSRPTMSAAFSAGFRPTGLLSLPRMQHGATLLPTPRGLRRHRTNAGRRSARARLADLLLEFWERLRHVGMAGDHDVVLPVPQAVVADALALTPVHVSRVLGELARDGAVRIAREQPRRIVIPDLARLRRIAGSEENPGPAPLTLP